MREQTLADLQLIDAAPELLGSAILARTATRHLMSAGGFDQGAAALAAVAIGRFAVLDGEVTARLCSGLSTALDERAAAAAPLYGALGSTAVVPADQTPVRWQPRPAEQDPEDWREHVVFSLVARHLRAAGLPVSLDLPEADLDGFRDAALRDQRGAPVGRLRFPVGRWLALDAESPRAVLIAALDLARRGADIVGQAMIDTHHWRQLHTGLAPAEPELLLVGLAFHVAAAAVGYPDDVQAEIAADPVLRAVLVTAADLLPATEWFGADDFARRWGGDKPLSPRDVDDPMYSWSTLVDGGYRW